ncbi:hypothetical protein ESZ50_10960 [Weissella muntiaci]|uniref:LXG domain-containing protein n=1 Tax=Weissella muntiaci TaxID=2508881 RepID=A0A6C2C2Y2_9LACO|nr:hypothetical protein [Weissella muntiaci]TYC47866.1 hypothetical protein ESZ50_10960 [Weissella muntiaci]
MGLRYLSSDSSGMKSNLKKTLQQSNQAIADLKSGSEHLVSAIDGRTLSGAAYTAGKGLFTDLIIPAIGNVSKALENVQTDLTKYESQEAIVSGESLLDEDRLNAERKIKSMMRDSAKQRSENYKQTAKAVEKIPILELGAGMFNDMSKQMDSVAKSYQDEITKIDKKLTKLHKFSTGIQGLFQNSLQELESAMKSVTSLNSAIVSSSTGKYVLKKNASRKNNKLYDSLKKGALTDGTLKFLEKLAEKGSKVLEDSSEYLAAVALASNGRLVQVSKYAEQVGKVGAKAGKASKYVPIIGSGLTFYDDLTTSHDFGQAVVHTGVSQITGTVIDGLGIIGGPFTGFASTGVAFLGNVGAQVAIDKFFEDVPMKKWKKFENDGFKKRAELNDEYITNNTQLSEDQKALLNKYSGDPMDVYRNLSGQSNVSTFK